MAQMTRPAKSSRVDPKSKTQKGPRIAHLLVTIENQDCASYQSGPVGDSDEEYITNAV